MFYWIIIGLAAGTLLAGLLLTREPKPKRPSNEEYRRAQLRRRGVGHGDKRPF